MIEINNKYRGKTNKGEWLYGSCIINKNNGNTIAYIVPETINCQEMSDLDNYTVIPETVGQFTGMADANGKEIYVGDVVEYYEVDIDSNLETEQETSLICRRNMVEFVCGMYTMDDNRLYPLFYYGLEDLNDAMELLGINSGDCKTDKNGIVLDEHILGIRVIGNITDNIDIFEK